MKTKNIFTKLGILLLIFCLGSVSAETRIYINPETQNPEVGDIFNVDISIDTGVGVAGLQTNLMYNPDVLEFISVEHGGFFDPQISIPDEELFMIDEMEVIHSPGSLKASGAMIAKEENVGVIDDNSVVRVQFDVISPGTSEFNLDNVKAYDAEGNLIEEGIVTHNGEITACLEGFGNADTNDDGNINTLDLFVVTDHWAEEGEPGFIKADVNDDGKINTLDLFAVTDHWAEECL